MCTKEKQDKKSKNLKESRKAANIRSWFQFNDKTSVFFLSIFKLLISNLKLEQYMLICFHQSAITINQGQSLCSFLWKQCLCSLLHVFDCSQCLSLQVGSIIIRLTFSAEARNSSVNVWNCRSGFSISERKFARKRANDTKWGESNLMSSPPEHKLIIILVIVSYISNESSHDCPILINAILTALTSRSVACGQSHTRYFKQVGFNAPERRMNNLHLLGWKQISNSTERKKQNHNSL